MLRNIKKHVEKDYDAMSKKAAEVFAAEVNTAPTAAYGFATGSTPEGMYKALIDMQKNGLVDLTRITAFNLDEYYPIRHDDPQSYYYYMRKNLFDEIGLSRLRTHIPDGEAPDPIEACVCYSTKISNSGGIKMQILGIGANGHIGFNEPAEALKATTHYVTLAEKTVESNARFFASPKDVPRHAITMGLWNIMMAKRILLLVSGEGKAAIINWALRGPISTQIPASLLQLHPDVTVILNKAAAAKL